MSAATTNQPSPTPIPGYQLIKRLGRGGFGEVWEVEAPGGIRKAMKFVYGDLGNLEDENIRAAEQELKALERVKNIRHPYILTLEQWSVVDGHLIIVMELASGNLWDRFKECRALGLTGIPREELLIYMIEAAEALDLMNDKFRIQHLDVKPQNLFLMYNHVKVADFGLAKAFEGGRGTVTGGVTPVYAGPETFEGYVSRFTDQYSLAIVFQELLTGTRPFNGSNTKQLVMQHLNGTPDLDHLPLADRPIIARALAKKPEDRWPSCTEMVKSLRGSTTTTHMTSAPTPIDTKPQSGVQNRTAAVRAVPPMPNPSSGTVGSKPTSKHANQVVTPTDPRRVSPIGPGKGATVNTPWPLATPRLVTPRGVIGSNATGSLPPIATLQRPIVVHTARMGALGLAQPTRTGDGVLLPALVIGVGKSGYLVIRALKRILQEQWGQDAVTHIRFLVIDTDLETQTLACDPNQSTEPLAPHEVYISRLNRVAHYLQSEGIPSVENWMPPGLLYKMPRNPTSAANVRAYGRLALVDHYKFIAQRIRQELETFVNEEHLISSIAKSGLGLRTNVGRTYIVANTAGGTGSGMFLDLGYIVRNELRQIGYTSPENIGLLMVPPADKTVAKNGSLANSYGALAELQHFMTGTNIYQMRFSNQEPQIQDVGAPFSRCSMFQLSKNLEPRELAITAGLMARTLYFELLTPLGRTADSIREEAFAIKRAPAPVVQASCHYRLCWPKAELLSLAANRLGQRTIQRWTSKDADHLRETITSWLNDQWQQRNLTLEVLVEQFNDVVRSSLRESPERVFSAFVQPLRQRGPGTGRLDQEATLEVLEQLLTVVGPPNPEPDEAATLGVVIAQHQAKLVKEAEGHLSTMAVAFLEQPQYRLSGTEEVIQQIREKLQRIIGGLEAVRSDVYQEVQNLYSQMAQLLQGVGTMSRLMMGPRKGSLPIEILDVLEDYPKKRLKLHVLDATLNVYRALSSSVPEYAREVEFCRGRLLELLNNPSWIREQTSLPTGPGRMILPHGVDGIDGAVDLFLGAMTPQDLLDFEQSLQLSIAKKFRSLIGVCLTPANAGPFVDLLLENCRKFLEVRLEQGDPAMMFFRYRAETAPGTPRMLMKSFEESAPDLTSTSGKSQLEATILGIPEGIDGERFKKTVESMLPDIVFHPATTHQEIVFYREYPLLEITELPQVCEYAQEVYRQKLGTEGHPHTRADIHWQLPNR